MSLLMGFTGTGLREGGGFYSVLHLEAEAVATALLSIAAVIIVTIIANNNSQIVKQSTPNGYFYNFLPNR